MKLFKQKRLIMLAVLVFAAAFAVFISHADGDSTVITPRFRSANPCPVIYTQPDGSQLTIQLRGDENVRFALTTDGFTILQDRRGTYRYGQLDNGGNLVISDVQASEQGSRGLREQRFLTHTPRYLSFSARQLVDFKKERQKIHHKELAGTQALFPPTGTRKFLVILVGFTDRPFTLTQPDFDGLMNTPGFNGYGSFKEYHIDNSFGQLTVNSTVVGPYTLSRDEAYYGTNRGGWDARPRNMVAEGIDAAEADGLDFSQFDNDGDGTVDGILVIHAGYDEAAGADTTAIWSHAWTLSNYSRTYDGVVINDYITTPELSGTSGANISDIGVLAHEFGHSMGLPDTYDTNYETGGYAYGPGYYDIMADGGWNNGGFTPANHTAYGKEFLGWQTPTLLNGLTTSISLPNANDNNISYRIDTPTANEYFLLENRQLVGWDEYIEGHGLLIYHVDGNFIDANPYDVNADPDHQGFDLEEADNEENWGPTAAGDPFPGTSNNTSFTDDTTPNARAWNGAASGVPITNIAENSGNITFDVGGSSGGNDTGMYIDAIDMTTLKQGKSYSASAVVTILGDPSGNPVANATVHITWSGVVSGTDSAVTDANGQVTFSSAKIRNVSGPFTITVTNVTHASLTYETALNVEDSGTISY